MSGFVCWAVEEAAAVPSSGGGGLRAVSADSRAGGRTWVDMLVTRTRRRWVDDEVPRHTGRCVILACIWTGMNARLRNADVDATDVQELQQRVATMNLSQTGAAGPIFQTNSDEPV